MHTFFLTEKFKILFHKGKANIISQNQEIQTLLLNAFGVHEKYILNSSKYLAHSFF